MAATRRRVPVCEEREVEVEREAPPLSATQAGLHIICPGVLEFSSESDPYLTYLSKKGARVSSSIRRGNASREFSWQETRRDPGYYICKPKLRQRHFEQCLTIYQNNQTVVSRQLRRGEISKVEARQTLAKLESWFILVLEPRPVQPVSRRTAIQREYEEALQDWHKREMSKQTGNSPYCDPDLKRQAKVPVEVLVKLKHDLIPFLEL